MCEIKGQMSIFELLSGRMTVITERRPAGHTMFICPTCGRVVGYDTKDGRRLYWQETCSSCGTKIEEE